jgi:hypothetical protein
MKDYMLLALMLLDRSEGRAHLRQINKVKRQTLCTACIDMSTSKVESSFSTGKVSPAA